MLKGMIILYFRILKKGHGTELIAIRKFVNTRLICANVRIELLQTFTHNSIDGATNAVPRGVRLPGRVRELANRLHERFHLRVRSGWLQRQRDSDADDKREARTHHRLPAGAAAGVIGRRCVALSLAGRSNAAWATP